RNDLEQFHVDSSIDYMLEAKLGYCFEDAHDQPIVVSLQERGEVYATHGYSPDKPDYTSVLVVSGEGIKSNYPFGEAEVVDLAPTIASMLGINFGPCDGKVLQEIFAED